MATFYHDQKLIRPFLHWLKVKDIPHLKKIDIGVQNLPGLEQISLQGIENSVPDAYFCDNESWSVIIESKVQSSISNSQLRRHQEKAKKYGYDKNTLVVIAVDAPKKPLPGVIYVTWKSIYQWFIAKSPRSSLASYFTDYMEIYESKMLAQDYNIKGTITMFSGFHFTKDTPYTYREGKRLIKILGQEFRKNTRLVHSLSIDPSSEGRSKIKQGENGAVWDFIRLEKAKSEKMFTSYPHATMVIRPTSACVAITIPNGIKGGIKKILKENGLDQFYALLKNIEHNLHKPIKNVPDSKPIIYLYQRFYRSQSSLPRTDGSVEVDLRTLVNQDNRKFRHQPMWIEAIFNLLTNKKTNMQFGIEARFPLSAKCMQSAKALDVMVDAWIAMKPIIEFITK